MKPLTIKNINGYYDDLPMYVHGGKALVQFGSGRRFAGDCVHDSFSEAETCGHSWDEWCKEATKCLILYEENNG